MNRWMLRSGPKLGLRLLCFLALILALILARQLLLVHGVAHAKGLAPATELEWVAAHEPGDSLCQALDDLGAGDAPLPLGLQLPPTLSAGDLQCLPQAQRLANGLWRASARGPPQG
ncbi:hypothetical protein HNQ51_001498 [Inhella inkyongensis]|uniref:Uncharacterized protein n=1 Tax=Inhella inkyongensis TaxID=392593 RepID=A0A840S1N8_9BURK|nr:hypothetical protein [Inhella inkyongensis]MBB5204205.1 hypothetical protein [Inhella inkyongensis]